MCGIISTQRQREIAQRERGRTHNDEDNDDDDDDSNDDDEQQHNNTA